MHEKLEANIMTKREVQTEKEGEGCGGTVVISFILIYFHPIFAFLNSLTCSPLVYVYCSTPRRKLHACYVFSRETVKGCIARLVS